jgi:UDP-glucose-4-epimerase GalE
MRVLVVGGAGYIGSHAVLSLRESGIAPVVYDNFSTGHRRLAAGAELVEGDIADYDRLRLALRNIDAVMHFAAKAYVGESVVDPRSYYQTNVAAALNLLNAAIDSGVKRFVFSSSCAVYGTPEHLPVDETAPRNPLSPYGATKAAFEDALQSYSAAYGLRFVALRYFNAAGADENGRAGELHSPETHLIPLILQAASGHIPSVSIFGDDYPTPDGTCVRDYVHVSDLASAHVAAVKLLAEGGDSGFINLGTGKGSSILELISAAEAVTGLKIPVTLRARRPGDPSVLFADCKLAKERLRWSARHDLRSILETAWRWHLANAPALPDAKSADLPAPFCEETQTPLREGR